MKTILTFAAILFFFSAGAQTSIHAVSCNQTNFFLRVSFADSLVPPHIISTTTCADGSVRTNEEGGDFIQCKMELFADAACAVPIPVDPRFFAFARDLPGSSGTASNPAILYGSNCQDTISGGSAYGYNSRTDYSLVNFKQCTWDCVADRYNCSYTAPGVPANYNIKINCCFAPGTLAVQLVSFQGRRSSGVNALYWELEQTADLARLVLERSFDGLRFDAVYSTTTNTHSISDRTDSTAYYRLRIFNTNGSYFISPVVVLKAAAVIRTLQVSPLPFKEVLLVSLTCPRRTRSVIQLCTPEGKTVFSTERELKAGANALSLTIPPVCKGIYILTVSSNEGTVAKKVMKQ